MCSGTVTNTGDLRLTEVEPGRRENREHDVALAERPPAGTRDRSEHADEPASARSDRWSGRPSNRGQIGRERLEVRMRPRPICERRPLRKLFERQAPVGGRFPQQHDSLLSLGVGGAPLELAHSSDPL